MASSWLARAAVPLCALVDEPCRGSEDGDPFACRVIEKGVFLGIRRGAWSSISVASEASPETSQFHIIQPSVVK